MKRIVKAVWRGGPRGGEGILRSASGSFDDVVYSIGTTAVDVPCTNPCELLAAAEAACVSLMAAQELERVGIQPESIESQAELDMAQGTEGWHIPRIHLTLRVRVDDMDENVFQRAMQRAKDNCPITRSLKAEVTFDAYHERTAIAGVAHA